MSVVVNKVALVTGGASGIGLIIVRELLKNGVKGVTVADINNTTGNEICNALNDEFGDGKVIFVKTDVCDKLQFESAMKKTVETFQNFDILVNNAGIFNDNKYEREVQINLIGVINGCILGIESYIPKFRSSSEGLIINIASILGLESSPAIPLYTATKHGIVGLSKALSSKVHYDATKVKIVTICPGYTETPLLTEFVTDQFLNERCAQAAQDYFSDPNFELQSVEHLGKAIIPIINVAENGSFWVVAGDDVSSVYLPEIKELKKLNTLKV